jgi:hypothetical protein
MISLLLANIFMLRIFNLLKRLHVFGADIFSSPETLLLQLLLYISLLSCLMPWMRSITTTEDG